VAGRVNINSPAVGGLDAFGEQASILRTDPTRLTRLPLHTLWSAGRGDDTTVELILNKETNRTMKQTVNVSDWVAMFQEIGLDQAQMERWHRVFETRHPEGHQSFLAWLGLKPEDIDRIRSKSR